MSFDRPRTRYAEADGARIAYQVVGEGPRDLVIVSGLATHLDLAWDRPELRAVLEGLGAFCRVVTFDKRGVGLSDRVETAPSLGQRIDDLRCVLDAADVDVAHFFGVSEGAPMAILFAASHPERVASLSLWGGMARTSAAPGYPFAPPKDALLDSATELLAPHWDEPVMFEVMQPSVADDQERAEQWLRYAQAAASPTMILQLFLMALDYDVRDVLGSLHVPTLVMHARGDRVVPVQAGRWLAAQIPNAVLREYDTSDHLPDVDITAEFVADMEEFLTGARTVPEPDRVLATVMFTDIVGSTAHATAMGDEAWRALLDRHNAGVRSAVDAHHGMLRKTLGDGALATFDSPARAIAAAADVMKAMDELGLDVRIGLHCGEVELVGDDIAGIAVHLAARVSATAAAGQVLVTRTIVDLTTGSGLAFDDQGMHELKGLDLPWHLLSLRRDTSAG